LGIEEEDILKEVTLLYVEDDVSIREIYGKRLEKKVANIHIAQDGVEGLSLYKVMKPDIILTDIQMPNMDGLEMIKEIRNCNNIDRDVAIIITTAFSEPEFFLKAISLHIDGYLIKPINKNDLFLELERVAKGIISKKREKQSRILLQTMLDFQESMVAVIQDVSLIYANKSFLNKFEAETVEIFNQNNSDLFQEIFSFNKKGVEDTIIVIDENRKIVPVIDIDVQEPQVFLLNSKYVEEMDHHIVNFTEITSFIEERNKLQKLAFYDTLTSIYNRSRFNQFLDSEVERAKRYKNHFTLLLFDIDFFKKINDKYGHLVGDEALKELSALIKSHIRKSDIFARWGGEEFAIIFSNTTIHTAEIATENLRLTVQENLFTSRSLKFTCSFGLTEYQFGDTKEELFKKADEALYRAKENGRNRIEFAYPDDRVDSR